MIKLLHAYFPKRTLLLALAEAVLITTGLCAATWAWVRSDVELTPADEQAIFKILFAASVCMVCMYYYDLYDSFVLANLHEVMARLVQVLGTACLILAVSYYVDPGIKLSRGIFLTGIALVGICLGACRKFFLVLNRSTRLAERALLMGDSPLANSLAKEFEKRSELGVRLLGVEGCALNSAPGEGGLHLSGGGEELPELVRRERIDRIIVTMSDCRGRLPIEMLLRLKAQGVRVEDGADVFESVTGKVPLDSLRLSWLLFSSGFRASRGVLLFKRIFSLIGSAVGLLVSLPVMALIPLAVRLDSPGPVVFRQQRMGKDGKTFTIYKFRTMRHGVEPDGVLRPAQQNDERFTLLGRWLRRTRLDELPQLYNILCGDMDFVGPRPFVPSQEKELIQKIPFYSQRLTVQPGATGWAQIHRGYCASLQDNVEKLAYDLYYIKNMSVGLDALILFQTVKILLLGRGGR